MECDFFARATAQATFLTKVGNNIPVTVGRWAPSNGWYMGKFVLSTRLGVGRASLLGPGGFPQQVTINRR